MKSNVPSLLLCLAVTIAPSGYGNVITSDELKYTLVPGNGAGTIPNFFDNLNPVITEDVVETFPTPSKLVLTYDPTHGLVAAKTIVLTEPFSTAISDIFTLTVNANSTVLTFQFLSDPPDTETGLVPPPGSVISIPESGDATHPLDENGFLNLTRDLFPNFAVGQEPVIVLAESDRDVVPEPSSGLLVCSGLIAFSFGYTLRKHLARSFPVLVSCFLSGLLCRPSRPIR